MISTGYIGSDGKYHREVPNISDMKEDRSSLDKEYSHDRQRDLHRKDVIQPYKNGQPNPEFITMYPEESKNYGFING